mmetsp:Transcript_85925/g.184156  ORF Transcript_85925/g.184156 Transcript_85925/m.184156 type:complete len:93 (+) Transcript_85925:123-401(+)
MDAMADQSRSDAGQQPGRRKSCLRKPVDFSKAEGEARASLADRGKSPSVDFKEEVPEVFEVQSYATYRDALPSYSESEEPPLCGSGCACSLQ